MVYIHIHTSIYILHKIIPPKIFEAMTPPCWNPWSPSKITTLPPPPFFVTFFDLFYLLVISRLIINDMTYHEWYINLIYSQCYNTFELMKWMLTCYSRYNIVINYIPLILGYDNIIIFHIDSYIAMLMFCYI